MTAPDPAPFLWSPLAPMPSVLGNRIVIVRGDGATIEDADGRRYLDATSSLWHANVGHGRASIAAAAAEQIGTLETYHSFGFFTNDRAARLSDRLAALSPIADPRIIFTSGGSDGVEVAAKLVRRYWTEVGRPEKRYILSRDDSYHGLHGYGTSLTGPEMYRAGYGVDSLVDGAARFSSTDILDLERLVDRIGPERIGAIITEPVIGSGGVIGPPPGYFERLQALAAEHDILVIADEVITGFGRVGQWFGSQRYGLRPDITVVAKGITSGYAALGAVFVGPRVWGPFYDGPDSPVYRHGVTYSGHATACAVADANLDILESEGLIAESARLERVLVGALDGIRDSPLIADIRDGVGLMAAVAPITEVPAGRVVEIARRNGVILREIRFNYLQISPPFITTDAEIARIVSVLADAVTEAAAP